MNFLGCYKVEKYWSCLTIGCWLLAVGCWLLAGLVGLFDWLEALAVCTGFLTWLFKPAVCKSVAKLIVVVGGLL